MRTNARIDKQQVLCPNASTLGYGKPKAQFGDLITFDEGTKIYIGRVAGRIAYAPSIEPNEKPIKNWLLGVALSNELSFVMERWVDPENVLTINSLSIPNGERIRQLVEFFLSPEFVKYSPEELRHWSPTGYSTIKEMKGKDNA